MSRKVKYGLSVFIIIFSIILGISVWLLGTSGGARWLLEMIFRQTPAKISVRGVDGNLWEKLYLEGLHIHSLQGDIQVERLLLRWQPLMILVGNVAIKELSINKILIQDNRPEDKKPPDLSWPKIAGLPGWLDGWIDRLRVQEINYRKMGNDPVTISTISSKIIWYNKVLTVRDLAFKNPSVKINGTVAVGFLRPSLNLELIVVPHQSIANVNQISVKANLLSTPGPEQVKGPMTLNGVVDKKQKISLSGEVGLTKRSLRLRKMVLKRSGWKGTLSGDGELMFITDQPELQLNIAVADLNLSPLLSTSTDIFGTIHLAGNQLGYRGSFNLTNKGNTWRRVDLFGSFVGDTKGIKLDIHKSSWLGGTFQGNMQSNWMEGMSVSGKLQVRDLNPAFVTPKWEGIVNMDLRGKVNKPKKGLLEVDLSGRFLESQFLGTTLKGDLEISLRNDNLHVNKFVLQGKGFNMNAKGELSKRLTFLVNINDLSSFVPKSRGLIHAKGWVGKQGKHFKASLDAQCKNLLLNEVLIDETKINAHLYARDGYPLKIKTSIKGLEYKKLKANSITFKADGSIKHHAAEIALRSSQAEMKTKITGTYMSGDWKAMIDYFSGHDAVGSWSLQSPAELNISKKVIFVSPLIIRGTQRELLEVNVGIIRHPIKGFIKTKWGQLNLSRINQWLRDISISGQSSGTVTIQWNNGDISSMNGQVDLYGTFTANDKRISLKQSSFDLDWNKGGLRTSLILELSEGGMLKGLFTSRTPVRSAFPEKGEIDISWQKFSLSSLRPLIPERLNMQGVISGQAKGKLLSDKRLDIMGTSTISGGTVIHQTEKGQLSTELRSAELSWLWRNESLSGKVSLLLAEHGNIKGSFKLPIPARLPPSIKQNGPIIGSLEGNVREKGLLTSLFPGLIRESHGDMEITLKVEGVWKRPIFKGTLQLEKAGAYLPTTGIRIKDVRGKVYFDEDLVRIDSFHAKSGSGNIEGTAVIRLENWQISSYEGSIHGERFQTVYLPELQVISSPQLKFTGTSKKLSIVGKIHVPELLVLGRDDHAQVKPSKDVVIVDVPKETKREFPMALDLQVHIIFGKRVFIKREGIDAQLEGNVDIMAQNIDEIRGRGEIHVVKGKYKKYGVNLEIKRGHLIFTGGDIENPTLDILALRTVGDVRVGIIVSGTPQLPVVNLYSDPHMTDVDILAYIVLGHSIGDGDSREQVNLVSKAASILLSKSDSVVFQDQLKSRVGIDVLDIQAGDGEISRSMVTIGKYLTPRLYISYGQSLFGTGNIFRVRYSISRHWEVETQSGIESGVDLNYKLDFR